MKNLKKILSIFLVVAMLVSCFATVAVFAADDEDTDTVETVEESTSGTIFSDIKSTDKIATAVTILNKLGIVTGYPDGTFGPNNNVTRAEFATMLLRMMNMAQNITPISTSFSDVAPNYWAAGTIEMSKSLNIVTGYTDGTFGPENNVSYEEALTMIVRAVGYENYSPEGGTWYAKYVESARRLGISKNAVGNVGSPATRACIAQFIYDTLEVLTRENNVISERTVMEQYLGLTKGEGVIASNAYTSLSSPDVELREDEIMITEKKTGVTQVYRVDNISEFDDKLGENVVYYYTDSSSDYRDISFFTVKGTTNSTTIDAASIEPDDCDDNTVAYYRSDSASNTTNIKLDDDNIVIYNGKLYGNNAAQSSFDVDMIPLIGEIKFLNTDNDGDQDILFIDSYEIYVVSSVTSSTYTITDKVMSTSGKSISLDPTDDDQIVNFVDTNGKELSFSSLRKNVTACVKESHDNNGTKMYTVVVVTRPVSGEVRSVSSSGCKVGATSYKYSVAAPWRSGEGDLTTPEKGGSYTFFLDLNGDIVAYTGDNTAVANTSYGYIMGMASEGSSGLKRSPLTLNMLTQSGSKIKIPLHDNTRINGEKIDGDYNLAEELLEEAATYQKLGLSDNTGRQLIKYTIRTLGGESVIDTIVTVTEDTCDDTKGGSTEADELRMFASITTDTQTDGEDGVKYTSSTSVFKSDSSSLYLGSAIVFVVPEKMSDSSGYRKGGSSDFRNNQYYRIEAFDISSSKNAKVIVLYGASGKTEVDYSTPLFRISEISTELNEAEDGSMTKVTGYESGSNTETSLWVAESSVSLVNTLDEGDIVRFGADSDGYATLDENDILYQVDVTDPYYYAEDEGRSGDSAKEYASSDLKVLLGSVYSTGDNTVILVPEFLDEDVEATSDIDDLSEVIRVKRSAFSGADFYRYNTGGRYLDITEITDDYQDILDSFITYDEELLHETTKVFVHLKDGSVKTVIVIE